MYYTGVTKVSAVILGRTTMSQELYFDATIRDCHKPISLRTVSCYDVRWAFMTSDLQNQGLQCVIFSGEEQVQSHGSLVVLLVVYIISNDANLHQASLKSKDPLDTSQMIL